MTMIHVTRSTEPDITFCGRRDNVDRCPMDTTLRELLSFMTGGFLCPGCMFSMKFRSADNHDELANMAKIARAR